MGLGVREQVWGPGVMLLTLTGDVDVYPAVALRKGLVDLIDNRGFHTLFVDLNEVDFLEATGFGVLVGALKRARAHNGSVELICRQERHLAALDLTGLIEIFRVYGSQDDARAHSGLA